jgi:hypothetical protein
MTTTTAAAKPDHRSLPRKKRPPTARDQAIFLAYRVTARTQAELAEDYDLSQRRISEIIKRVERWRADLIPAEAGELEPKQQQRVDRWLEHERLRSVHDRAIRAYDTQALELKTTRKGDRDGKPFHDETTRQQQPNVQLLKVALRAASDMGKLEDKPSLDAPVPGDAHERFWAAHALICELRRAARQRGDVAASNCNESAFVMHCLNVLLGKETAGPGETESATAGVPQQLLSSEASAEPQPYDSSASALNVEPETLNPASGTLNLSNRSNDSNPAAAADSSATLAEATVNTQPDSTSGDPPLESGPPSPPKKKKQDPEPEPSLLERRIRHQEKLVRLREAMKSGLPFSIEFDPADGPVPRLPLHIDDYGYQPSPPPSSAQIHAQNSAYLNFLQEQAQRCK